MPDFTHLHLHTEFSVLDGINRLDKLCNHVKNSGMTACAVTDHGSMGGLIEFWKAAKKTGIKPLMGMEAYITWDKDNIENPQKHQDNFHCILIAMNNQGLANLITLNNLAYLNNFYYKPRVNIDNLVKHSEGLIGTSSCLGGVVRKFGVLDKDQKTFVDTDHKARESLEFFAHHFKGRFYAEIQDSPGIWEQETYNQWLIKNAKECNVPLVITSDAHFLTETDYETHRLVIAKNTGKPLSQYIEDSEGLSYHKGHHVRVPEKMLESAIRLGAEEAFWNTTEIAKQCDVQLTLGEYKHPIFDVSAEADYQEFIQWEKQRFQCK